VYLTVFTKDRNPSYPYGPARNPTSVQRGSVDITTIYPGDPTTPGYPSYENCTRVEASTRPMIPSLPISWNTAQVLLKEIAEGKEGRRIRFVNNGVLVFHSLVCFRFTHGFRHAVTDAVTPIWNVMAVIPGHIHDEVVMVGCHRDGPFFFPPLLPEL
jgi:N-acetylated-alpha-linked acidic dipeptidase